MTQDNNTDMPTRQIYASIREDVYLAAKAKATELRMPMKRFIEQALLLALSGQGDLQQPQGGSTITPLSPPSIWDDEYLRMQASQPVGSPVELSEEEAAEIVRASFGSDSQD